MSKALDIPPSIIFSEYNAAAGELAKYGQNSTKVFKELAAESKATGLSVQELINVSKGFDTFQGAAEQAPKLNAVLAGPYFDTVSMIGMSEAERNQHIREQIKLQGVNFDAMSRSEAQMVATAMGFQDVGKAMQFMREGTDVLDELVDKATTATFTQEQLELATQDAMGLQEKLSLMMKGLAVNLAPILKPLNRIADAVLRFLKLTGDGQGILSKFVDYAVMGLEWVADGVEWLVDKFEDWMKSTKETASATEEASLNMKLAIGIVQDVVEMLVATWEAFKRVAIAVWPVIKIGAVMAYLALLPVINAFKGLWWIAKNLFTGLLIQVAGAVKLFKFWYLATLEISTLLIEGVLAPFKAIWEAGEGIANMFDGKGPGDDDGWMGKLGASATSAAAAIENVIAAKDKLKDAAGNVLSAVPGGAAIATTMGIPAAAEGGIVTGPTIAQIGEQGAEAIIPLEGRGLNMLSDSLAGSGLSAAAGGLKMASSAAAAGGAGPLSPGVLAQVVKEAIIEGFKQSAGTTGGDKKPVRNIELKIDKYVLARVMDDVFEEKVGLK